MVYEPAEDSALLAKAVKKYAKGKVLDVGTGSGYLAGFSVMLPDVESVLGVDLDPQAVAYSKKHVKGPNVSFIKSDLFSNVSGKFDTIIFNPPYLPRDKEFHDIALHGGRHGYETICKFISQVGDYLNVNGKILLLFSSLSKKSKVLESLDQNMYEYKEFDNTHVFFEDLFVYVIKKRKIRRDVERKGVLNLRYFDHGKRGVIFTGKYKGKKVAIKIRRDSSTAIDRIANEAKWLAHLKNTSMCPLLIFSSDNFLCYEFVEGVFLPEFLMGANKADSLFVLGKILGYCRALDMLGVNKEEMTRPIKHVLIKEIASKWKVKGGKEFKVTMLDFERCRFTAKPSNVTQFVQYLTKADTKKLLKGSVTVSVKILDKARDYKRKMDDVHFKEVLNCLK